MASYDSGKLGTPGKIFLALAVAFLAVFLLYPVGYSLAQSLFYEGSFNLRLFALVFRNGLLRESIVNSFNLSLAALAGTVILALPLAALTARYSFIGKRWVTGLLLAPMIMPPFVGVIGMRHLLAREGSVNLLLLKLGIVGEPISFLSGSSAGAFWAVVLLEILHLYPIMYLNAAAALANVDPSLEDAARNLGDRGFRLFRRITLPLMMPGFLAGAIIVFIWAFTDLGTPLMFNYTKVVATQIFNNVRDVNENPMGYALVVLVVALTTAAFILSRLLQRGQSVAAAPRGIAGGAEAKLSAGGTALAYTAIFLVLGLALLPHFGVVLTSIADPGSWRDNILPAAVTGEHYGEMARHPLLVSSVRNSVILSLGSTALDIVLGVGLAYLLARRRFRGQLPLDAAVMLPLALPGIVIAFGYVGCFSNTFLDPRKHSPMPLLMIGYAIRRLPYMARAVYAGLSQGNVEMEEASQNLGAGPARTMRRVTLPLIFINALAGAILCFSFALLEVSDSLLLAFQEKYYPITKAIYQVSGTVHGEYTAAALGVLAMAMLLVTLIAAGAMLGKRLGTLFRA